MNDLHPNLTNNELELISTAVEAGARQYFEERRYKIPGFVSNIYSVKGSLRTNRKALGLDMLRAPLNLFWAVPYLGLHGISKISHKSGLSSVGHLLSKTPPGFVSVSQYYLVEPFAVRQCLT